MFPRCEVWRSALANPTYSPLVKINKWNVGIWNATKFVNALNECQMNEGIVLVGHSSLPWPSECSLLSLPPSDVGHSRLIRSWFSCTSTRANHFFPWIWFDPVRYLGLGYAYQISNSLSHWTYQYSCIGENSSCRSWSRRFVWSSEWLIEIHSCYLGGHR